MQRCPCRIMGTLRNDGWRDGYDVAQLSTKWESPVCGTCYTCLASAVADETLSMLALSLKHYCAWVWYSAHMSQCWLGRHPKRQTCGLMFGLIISPLQGAGVLPGGKLHALQKIAGSIDRLSAHAAAEIWTTLGRDQTCATLMNKSNWSIGQWRLLLLC